MTTILNNVPETPKVRRYRYSEIFGRTIQGEGAKTGVPTVWVRWWGCNFNCASFGQSHLPIEQQIDPYADIDVSKYNSMEELPVFDVGCDSGYSWSRKFSHLAHQKTAVEIAAELRSYLPGGTFKHPTTGQYTDLAFTGGEPMMSQTAIVDVMRALQTSGDMPQSITIETNGTQMARHEFNLLFHPTYCGPEGLLGKGFSFTSEHKASIIDAKFKGELFWSASPKLSVSGEMQSAAIRPDVLADYYSISPYGQLKFVANGQDHVWNEVEEARLRFNQHGVDWNTWIMPVGATLEAQEATAADVARGAIERGYNVSIRAHVYLFGNTIGT